MSTPWRVFRSKIGGLTPGFQILDGRGDRYVIKFDPVRIPELSSAAEVIATKLYGSSHKCVHDSAPAGRPRRGKRVRMRSCQLTSGEVVCRSVDGRLRGPRF